jgi:hypothetical protein
VTVSEHDKRYMRKLAEFSAELEAETGTASDETRRWSRAFINPRRAKIGLPPLEEDKDPPELEFYRRARALGMLRRGRTPS